MNRKRLVIILLLVVGIITGCGEDNSATSQKENQAHYPLTIKNVGKEEDGTDWKEVEQTFTEKPKKVVANTRPAAELLLHLGLKDQIAGVGAVFGEADKSVEKEFKELKQLSTEYIPKEVALSVDPDLVYGRGNLFDNKEWGVGTVSSLNEMGIKTYILEASVSKGTFENVYEDIQNLGNIFDVAEQADTFSAQIKEQQTELDKKLKTIKEEKTFAYLHMTDPDKIYVYSLADYSFSLSVLKMVKLTHVFEDVKEEVSIEALIEKDPDVLLVPSFDGYSGKESNAAKIVESLYQNPKIASLKAIKNKEIYTMDYNYMFGYGYQSLEGVEGLAKQMYPDLIK